MQKHKTAVLVIMDGWGLSGERKHNAVYLADKPNVDRLCELYPNTKIKASGEAVGLPEGQMGNSEVGHLNLGSGRIVYQELVRISRAIRDGDFFKNEALLSSVEEAKRKGSAAHILGLLSDGGVHSHLDHVLALVRLCKKDGIERVFLHCFLDGRDTPPQSALNYIERTERELASYMGAKIASVGGRYYGMDRDNRWNRVEKAYDAIVLGEGPRALTATDAVNLGYSRGEMDELMLPTVIVDANDQPIGPVRDGDICMFANFRADRTREMTSTLIDPGFDRFERKSFPKLASYVCMTEYKEEFGNFEIVKVAYPPQRLERILGAEIEAAGKRQFHSAETEKYAHVTFFFNGGVEEPFEHEDRLLIPSPSVATYDLKPEMSAYEVRDAVVNRILSRNYAFVVVNFANADMVGHTGDLEAAIKAVETVDECVGEVVKATLSVGGCAIVTADHGNAEKMWDEETGAPHTAHTTNPVPCIIVADGCGPLIQDGKLADVAPTILTLLELDVPEEMNGTVLFKN
ncbi:MAG: 2,3-bisphosphoglycerate-independent phosphoglycerate mutase [Candidatus Coatesbacteria bacterium]|nr:2,3-bisphosphoglycerate-independent phosphoglycerate mutase [Candidatus Coatesbacteria bacterium]